MRRQLKHTKIAMTRNTMFGNAAERVKEREGGWIKGKREGGVKRERERERDRGRERKRERDTDKRQQCNLQTGRILCWEQTLDLHHCVFVFLTVGLLSLSIPLSLSLSFPLSLSLCLSPPPFLSLSLSLCLSVYLSS
jgi:hypothetical protein